MSTIVEFVHLLVKRDSALLSRLFKVIAILTSASMLLGAFAISANAITNGKDATGYDYVVSLINIDNPTVSLCSAAYLKPKVVVTAAHCVTRPDGGRAGEYSLPLGKFFVSQPGADLNLQNVSELVEVKKIWTRSNYFNRWQPELGLMDTQVHDIAFLFLEEELNGPHIDRIATANEIKAFKQGRISAFQVGYGYLGESGGQLIVNDGKPYLARKLKYRNVTYSHIPKKIQLSVEYPKGLSNCPGDSGSPLLAKVRGKTIYLATIFAGSTCWANGGINGNPRSDALATVAWPYEKDLKRETRKYLRESANR